MCCTPKHPSLNFSFSSGSPVSPKTPASDTPSTPLRSAGLLSDTKYDFLMQRHEKLDFESSTFDEMDEAFDSTEDPLQAMYRIVHLPTQKFLKFLRDRQCNK